jgi:hypothetical protein
MRSATTTKSTTVSRDPGRVAARSNRASSGSGTRTAASVSAIAITPLRDNSASAALSSDVWSRYSPLPLNVALPPEDGTATGSASVDDHAPTGRHGLMSLELMNLVG